MSYTTGGPTEPDDPIGPIRPGRAAKASKATKATKTTKATAKAAPPPAEDTGPPPQRGLLGRLYHGETNFDFIGRRRLWFALSLIIILAGLLSLFTRGLNLGIEFDGGTVWEVDAGDASVDDAREAVEEAGLEEPKVQSLSSSDGDRLRISAESSDDEQQVEISEVLAELTGTPIDEVSVNSVGPSWGDEITDKAQRALVIFLIVITIYISFRFEWKMAAATLVALLHDILVTVGIYSLAGFVVTPATVIAILTILGYSIYDGIVVFDRVDENAKTLAATGKTTYSQMVNDSLNEVLMRTLNTSITALLPILSLLVIGSFALGATTLQEFGLALFIGLGASAYSSIFIASPVLAMLKEREARWANLRRRLESGRAGTLAPGSARRRAATEEAFVEDDEDDLAAAEASSGTLRPGDGARGAAKGKRPVPASTGPIAPRARKKGKRR